MNPLRSWSKLRFDSQRLRRTFPDAWASLQKRPGGVDWLMLVEGDRGEARGFVPLPEILKALEAA